MAVSPIRSRILSKGSIVTLGLVSAIGYASLFMVLPAIPEIGKSFHVTTGMTQLTISLSFIVMGLGQFGFGLLADRYSKKNILLISMLMFVFSSLIAANSISIEQLVLGRILQTFSGSAGITIARSIALDSGTRDQAASTMAYIFLPITLVPLIASPLSGAITDMFNWRWIFHFTAVLGLLGFLFVIFLVSDTSRVATQPRRKLTDIKPLWYSQRFKGYCGHHSFVVVALQVINASTPIIIILQLGFSATEYGIFASIPALGSITGAIAGGKLATKLGGDKLISAGSLIALLSYIFIVAMATMGQLSPWTIFLPMILISFSNAMILPSSSAGALEGLTGLGGFGAGLMGMIQWLSAGIMVQFAAFWVESSAITVFLLSLCVYLCGIFSFYYARIER